MQATAGHGPVPSRRPQSPGSDRSFSRRLNDSTFIHSYNNSILTNKTVDNKIVKQPTLQQQQQHRTTILPSKKKPWGEGPSIGSSRLPPLNLNGQNQVNRPGVQQQQQHQQLQRRWSRTSTTHRESSLLGDLHVDKIYLERLLQNPGKTIRINRVLELYGRAAVRLSWNE